MCNEGEVYGMWKEFTEPAREISLRSRRDRDERFFLKLVWVEKLFKLH